MSDHSAEGFIAFLAERQLWMQKAACRDTDLSLFILEQGHSASRGREFCNSCSVTVECNEYGKLSGSVGLWGGEVLTQRREPKRLSQIQDARPQQLAPPKRRKQPPASDKPLPMAARKRTG